MDVIGTIPLAAVAAFRHGIVLSGNPFLSFTQTSDTPAELNIGVLVFREGLECVLVLVDVRFGGKSHNDTGVCALA
jgi:hypothetical protein